MKFLKFLETGEIRSIKSDITLFSNTSHDLPRNCQTIFLQDIERKQCVIIKDEHVLKIMDLASFKTKICIRDEETCFNLVPFKFYELREQDRIFIGDHEILISSDSSERRSLFVPETQPEDYIIKKTSTLSDEHVEIPETQRFDTQMEQEIPETQDFDSPMELDLKETQIDVENTNNMKFMEETQPLLNIVPRFTRAKTLKLAKIKPNVVPLANFDFNSLAFNVETQPISYDETTVKKESLKPKPKNVQKKSYNKREMNSILLSEDELSDTDDERSSTVINGIILSRKNLEDDNSLDISINDELDATSQIFDSQFLEKVNESSSENYSLVIQSDIKEEKVEIKTEDVTKEEDNDSDEIIKPRPKKKIKLFKYNYSDDDD